MDLESQFVTPPLSQKRVIVQQLVNCGVDKMKQYILKYVDHILERDDPNHLSNYQLVRSDRTTILQGERGGMRSHFEVPPNGQGQLVSGERARGYDFPVGKDIEYCLIQTMEISSEV